MVRDDGPAELPEQLGDGDGDEPEDAGAAVEGALAGDTSGSDPPAPALSALIAANTIGGPLACSGNNPAPATPEEAAEHQLDAAPLANFGDDPHARLPPELADKRLAAFRDRTYVGLVTAGAVGHTLRKDGRFSELLELFEEYPAPHGSGPAAVAARRP